MTDAELIVAMSDAKRTWNELKKTIEDEHTKRIAEMVEGMRLEDDGYDTMVKSSLVPIEPYSWNAALDAVIEGLKKINSPSA